MATSDRLKINYVEGVPDTLHAYLDNYYVARIFKRAHNDWIVDGPYFPDSVHGLPSEHEARELVRVQADRIARQHENGN